MDHLWIIDADGTNEQKLIHVDDPLSIRHPSWSPDGSRIVFELAQKIHIYSLESQITTVLTQRTPRLPPELVTRWQHDYL